MTAAPWRSVPLELGTDLDHGGRWTSLRTATREWCWTNPDDDVQRARPEVRAGHAFVDAGGVEECLPTVRGRPDHGNAWSQPWRGTPADASVVVPAVGTLRRRVRSGADVGVRYELRGEPGTPFLHAVHALLELSPAARITVPQARSMTLLDGDGVALPWPSGLDRLGPDDGSADCALIPDCSVAIVVDRDEALKLEWWADRPGLCSLLLWRNLGGWPPERPYRSIGVEPMVGRAADLSTAGAEQRAELDDAGTFTWNLQITALRRSLPGEVGTFRPRRE